MPEHPNATSAREAFEALWTKGDLEPSQALMHDDVHWINDIGAGHWHEIQGKKAVVDMLSEWMAFFDGGFEHQLIDVCASDNNVIEILREVGTARGQRFDNVALYHFKMNEDGLATEVRTYDRDREAIAAFWRAIGPVAAPPAIG